MKKSLIISMLLSLLTLTVLGNYATIKGTVTTTFERYPEVPMMVFLQHTTFSVEVQQDGTYRLDSIPFGTYEIVAQYPGVLSYKAPIKVNSTLQRHDIAFDPNAQTLSEVEVSGRSDNQFGIAHMPSVKDMTIFAGKKSELIQPDVSTANLANNSGRQVFAKVAGVNVWESDGSGLQLGIGTRGLSPNRTANVNTRQNGYDIAADALGYPESYYTPPMEALSGIEVIKGAATLQYGTQFGGVVNFKLKNQNISAPLEIESRQTVGSFGLFNTFNSIGRKKGKNTWYGFVNLKSGNGWRPNSQFDYGTGFISYQREFKEGTSLGIELTKMHYLAQQPGGLTDAMFEVDPKQSIRERNWFRVNWNIVSVRYRHKFNQKWRMELMPFALLSSKDALGILTFINRADPLGQRDYYRDEFQNYGMEGRLIHTYKTKNTISNLLLGYRVYRGNTVRKQGLGDDGSDASFGFIDPDHLAYGDYTFPSTNLALFAENVFQLSPSLSITPGVRYEHIFTGAEGYSSFEAKDLAGNVLERHKLYDTTELSRDFVLFGLGVSKKLKKEAEIYANFSQNYRAVTFNDLKASVPNLRVDPNLKDETGYTFDIGLRRNHKNRFIFDINGFAMIYNNRIGSVLQKDEETYQVYRFRTNISDSRTLGVESFAEVNIIECAAKAKSNWCLSIFGNASYMYATYNGSEETAFDGNRIELVPEWNIKSGIKLGYKNLVFSTQLTYLTEQYTDATNATLTPTAINGLIPSYYVIDNALALKWKQWFGKVGVNNATNNMYFTRRATGYPGPGIIPSDGRSFYLSIAYKWKAAK